MLIDVICSRQAVSCIYNEWCSKISIPFFLSEKESKVYLGDIAKLTLVGANAGACLFGMSSKMSSPYAKLRSLLLQYSGVPLAEDSIAGEPTGTWFHTSSNIAAQFASPSYIETRSQNILKTSSGSAPGGTIFFFDSRLSMSRILLIGRVHLKLDSSVAESASSLGSSIFTTL